jgi:hypothetical protein
MNGLNNLCRDQVLYIYAIIRTMKYKKGNNDDTGKADDKSY